MIYCQNCGTPMNNDAKFCEKCGMGTYDMRTAPSPTAPQSLSGLKLASFILMIVATIFQGIYLIPLAWCIPMTVAYYNKATHSEPVSVAFKVCNLIFVSWISGILMLVDTEK